MPIINLLSTQFVIHNLQVGSKKRTLDHISAMISDNNESISHDEIFSGLIERERLGSTGIGEGIAIPHCRLDHLDKAIGVFLKLDKAVDFDAIDRKPVDLVFALIVPSNCCDEHLHTLGKLAEIFSDADNRDKLRLCVDSSSLYNQIISLANT
ncbi:MAG: PTS sugar transporter subunit IIA [Oceanospirillaceae bacterium]